jgi:WD40 repeat protein
MKKIIYCLVFIIAASNALAQDADLFWKNGHKTEIKSMSISPDNKTLVSVENDTLAIIWDIGSAQQIRAIKGVEAARFRDNNSIYLAMTDKTFKLVDLAGQTITRYNTKTMSFSFNSFSFGETPRLFYPEEGYYFYADYVFDINKGYLRKIAIPGKLNYSGKAFSPKTNRIALADENTRKVSLIDISTGNKVAEYQTPPIKDNNSTELEPVFSPDGQQLLIDNDEFVQVIDIASGKTIRTIRHGRYEGEQSQFSPDGKKIAMVLKNYDIQAIRVSLVDIATGAVNWTKDYPDIMFLNRLQFSPGGESLAVWISSDERENIYLFNVRTGATTWNSKQEELSTSSYGSSMEFSPDGTHVLAGNNRKLFWINTVSGKTEQAFIQQSQGYIGGIYFAKNNTQLTAQANNHLFTWNLQTGIMENAIPDKDKGRAGQDSPFSPAENGKSFFVARNDLLREIDTAGKLIHQYVSPKKLESRKHVRVSFDGRYVMNEGTSNAITCGKEKEGEVLEVFDTKSHQLVFSRNCVSTNAGFMRTKNVVAVQEGETAFLNFYELPSGRLLYKIPVPMMTTYSDGLFFTSNDRYLAIKGTNDDKYTQAIIVDMETRQATLVPFDMKEAIGKSDKNAWMEAVGITGDDKYMVFQSWRATIFVFLDIEKKRFESRLMTRNPGGTSMFSFMRPTPTGNYLLLGTYNGTIQLFDYEQKKIKGTLYPDAAHNNWAVVSSDGSFEGNEGAQANMFHVTGSTVVPISAVFEQFYRPRLLPRILNGEEFDPSPVDVNSLKRAPDVKIKFTEGTRNLEIGDDDVQTVQTKIGNASMAITAVCPTDGVTEIRLYQNGKLVETTRNLIVEDDNTSNKTMAKTFQVSLVEGANRFRAIAFNTQRTESKPVEMNVQYKPEKAQQTVVTTGIQLHVVVVGINVYKNPKYNLNYAQADAEAFRSGISKGAEGLYSNVQMHYIQDGEANRSGIVAALDKVKSTAKAEDVFVFYYAGHGVLNDKKEFYLVPSDVTQLYGNDGALAEKGLSAAVLQQYSKDIRAQKQLYILDACQSAGALDNIVALRGAAEEKAIAQLARSTGTHWLTASGSSQFASEFTQLGHGAFTYCLLEAFKGGADNGDRKITVKEMDAYLQNKVPEVTQKYRGAVQYPSSYGYGNDFPLIMVR